MVSFERVMKEVSFELLLDKISPQQVKPSLYIMWQQRHEISETKGTLKSIGTAP